MEEQVDKKSADLQDIKIQAYDKKVIYVYKHLDVKSHEGFLKVGETHASRITGSGKNMRILEQNTAANVAYEVLYTTDAVRNNGTEFSDKDIHELLVAMDIEREQTINPDSNKPSEWFKTDLKTIVDAINEYKMEAVKDEQGIIKDYNLRDEQKDAVQKTADYYEECQNNVDIEPQYLWNAKPRFGKTLTAYNFASQIAAKKVLIVTNRPAIADSWYTDFKKFDFKDTNQEDGKFRWIFTSSESVKNRLGKREDIYTRNEQLDNPVLLEKHMIHFISLQDIKGHTRGMDDFKEKNRWIFDLEWDLVIIDESHEGVDTHKAFRVFDNVHTNFTLHLSGTPFKAIASNRFSSKQIYNWSYQDEQAAKENWPIDAGPNPYAGLPKMHIFTYQLSRILETTAEEAKSEGSEYAFDLSEFFRVVKVDGEDRFAYEDKVKLFIENLRNPNFQYPFSNDEYRESLRHTFWLLPGVKACEQMKKMLLEDEWFKANYSPEDIIMAAGDGDEDRLTNTALDEVRRRIGEEGKSRHPLETRTITLSCGQLTTGITIPAWTAVIMLNNCKSPSLYMQSAFRAQNPFSVVKSGDECFMKENCFVFDFAPDRILQTLAEIADSGVSDTPTRTREEKVKILINFLPVIAEDSEGRMKYLDANEVLTIPLKLVTEEVVNRGFMSNRLFKNISGIFGCPQDIKDIINKMDEAKAGKNVEKNSEKKNKVTAKPRVWVDKDKKIHINEDIVVATTNGLLGEKKYVEVGSPEGKEVEETISEAISQGRAAGYSPEALKAVKTALTSKMPKLVMKLPDPAPEPGDPDYHEKEEPDKAPAKNEKTEEEKVRDRLRGFARTIPSFLMAYGSADTKLENFGDDIPDDVFEEISSITKEDFRKLRDGMDYEAEDENGEKVTRHFDGLFDEAVFNSSIQQFNNKRKELACYYRSDSTEDIFEYIPPQANNQIFTPKRVVKMMVDTLEKENPGIFGSTTNTFIDLYMKSGMYITEIVKRIFEKTLHKYSNDIECVKHILEHQVYGFAPTPILDAITRNYIFGFDPEVVIDQSHFVQKDLTSAVKNDSLEQEINRLFNNQGEPMKFTAVIGNPPYQEMNENNKMSRSIYPVFVDQATKISNIVSLIMPARWMSGEEGPYKETSGFVGRMKDYGIKDFTLYPNSRDLFKDVDIKGGVCYFILDKTHSGDTKYTYVENGNKFTEEISFDNKLDDNIIIRFPELASIVNKINYGSLESGNNITESLGSMKTLVSSRNPYGFISDLFTKNHENVSRISEKREKEDDYKIIGLLKNKRVIRYIPNEALKKNIEGAQAYKVLVPRANGSGAFGEVFSTPMLGTPMLISTDTFLQVGKFDNKIEAENLLKYVKTKFFRAMVGVKKVAVFNYKDAFTFVPIQDFTNHSDIDWSQSISKIDQQLYKKYGLSKNEIDFIEEKVQPME